VTPPREPEPDEYGGSIPDDEIELAFLPGTFPATEFGNAERMVAQNRDSIRYCAERKLWLIWNGREWQWDRQRLIVRKAKATVRAISKEAFDTPNPDKRKSLLEWALKSEKSSSVAAMIELAKSEQGMPVLLSECDRDPWLLNCLNGTLDLRSGKLRPHSRDDLITRSTGVTYTPGARSPLWESVLETATNGDADLGAYLQRVAGYSLAGVATEKKFFFLCGAPNGGKSTLIHGLHAALGGYACSTDFDTWLQRPQVGGNRNDLVALQGARLVTSVEVSKKAKWDTALIKRITGGDTIKAMAKYEDQVEYVAACTIILAANDSPKARDDDPGFWSRMCRIPFNLPLPAEKQIRGLGEKLREPEHASAVLDWAVKGFAEWQRIGIGTTRIVEESTHDYRAENDWLAGFLEQYELDECATIPAPVFRDSYERYCKQEGQFTESTKELARQIEERLPSVRYAKVNGVRLWRGLILKSGNSPGQSSLPGVSTVADETEEPPQRAHVQRNLGFTQEPPEGRFDDDN
jgi:putative DNA primase/helicase